MELKPTNQQNELALQERATEILLEETKLLATFLYQKTPNTRKAYESDIKKFFAFYRGKTLRDITPAHIVVYFKNHPELKESSKARVKSSLSSLFKFCVRQRYLIENPCSFLDPVRVIDQTQFRVLSHEELVRMIELEPSVRNQILIRLLYKTGLRVSELCSLKFSNLRKRKNSYFLIVVGKGNKTRTIGLDERSYAELNSLKESSPNRAIADSYIFKQKHRNLSLSRVSVWKIVKKAAIRAGLSEKVSPHWTRHSHATKALELGEDLRIIQHTLGHESIVTTTKYAKVFPGKSSGDKIDI